MKHKLHKKVDKIKTSMPWEAHPYLAISIKDFNWMRETIISLEKENQRYKQALDRIVNPIVPLDIDTIMFIAKEGLNRGK
jgi:hypothetical protein